MYIIYVPLLSDLKQSSKKKCIQKKKKLLLDIIRLALDKMSLYSLCVNFILTTIYSLCQFNPFN